jgi:hypothetical protein
MSRLTVAGLRSARTVSNWEPVRFAAPAMGATLAMGVAWRSGFERAAEDPLGARE